MASRYMNYLRKNAKTITVFMGIVCMITFVVGTALMDLAANVQRSAQNQDPVVVTWTKGSVRGSELNMLRFRHQLAYAYLYRVIATALDRGGKPMLNGRPITAQQQFIDVGIPESSSDQSIVQTIVLAEEARRMGVVVDLDSVKDFLRQLSSPELKEGDWHQIAAELVNEKQITVNQLFEHLQFELAAQHVRMLAMAGLYAQGVGPIVPPGEAFELFNRLNRRLTIEAYPIEVKPLISQVKGEPTDAEMQKLFDEGKYRDPDPNINEPGFHKPHKLAFTYLKVNFAPFLDEAKKQITDAQIEEAYQKDISQGLHKVQELPAATPPGEKKDDENKDEKKDGQKPADDAKEKEDSKPAAEKPADKPDEKAAADKKDEKSGCTEDEPQKSDSADKTTDKPVADTKPDERPAESKPAESKPDETPPAPANEQKYKPLSEVRDQILTRLAQPFAEDARKKAVAEVTAAVEKYGKAYRRYLDVKNVRKDADVKDPGKLDILPLAAKYSFPIGETPLVDRHEVANYEIGQKVQQLDMAAIQMRQIRMLSFADIAFSQDQPLYRPEEARSSDPDSSYVYFRTAEEKAADVTVKQVRPQVVEFWKQQKAFELALIDAQKLAEKAKGAATLAEAVPDATKVINTPHFSWMTAGGFGFGQPELSTVAGIDLPGREFMQSVFALKAGETGAAPNQAHSKVYVVRAVSQDPDDERLRTQFLESGYNQLVLMLAQGEALHTSVQWYRGVADQYQVKWQRPPQDDRRM
jgi:hypothetical protein